MSPGRVLSSKCKVQMFPPPFVRNAWLFAVATFVPNSIGLVQQWIPGTRCALLDEPAVAPIAVKDLVIGQRPYFTVAWGVACCLYTCPQR